MNKKEYIEISSEVSELMLKVRLLAIDIESITDRVTYLNENADLESLSDEALSKQFISCLSKITYSKQEHANAEHLLRMSMSKLEALEKGYE